MLLAAAVLLLPGALEWVINGRADYLVVGAGGLLAVGVALGSSAAGWVVDASGAVAGYAVPVVAGALAAAVALLGYRRLAEPAPTGGRGEDDRHLRTNGEHVA